LAGYDIPYFINERNVLAALLKYMYLGKQIVKNCLSSSHIFFWRLHYIAEPTK